MSSKAFHSATALVRRAAAIAAAVLCAAAGALPLSAQEGAWFFTGVDTGAGGAPFRGAVAIAKKSGGYAITCDWRGAAETLALKSDSHKPSQVKTVLRLDSAATGGAKRAKLVKIDADVWLFQSVDPSTGTIAGVLTKSAPPASAPATGADWEGRFLTEGIEDADENETYSGHDILLRAYAGELFLFSAGTSYFGIYNYPGGVFNSDKTRSNSYTTTLVRAGDKTTTTLIYNGAPHTVTTTFADGVFSRYNGEPDPANLIEQWKDGVWTDENGSWTDVDGFAPQGEFLVSSTGAALARLPDGRIACVSPSLILVSVAADNVAPEFKTQPPETVAVIAGKTLTLKVGVAAAGDKLSKKVTYQWFDATGAPVDGATKATLTLKTKKGETGESGYYCVVTNGYGEQSISNVITVSAQSAPVIAANGQPAAHDAVAGDTVAFSVSAAGTEPLHYTWRLNGKAIPDAPDAPTLTVTAAAATAGKYTVVVSNAVGKATSKAAALKVSTPPAVVSTTPAGATDTAPAALTVTAGKSAKFSVKAAGTAKLRYQWFRVGDAGGAFAEPVLIPKATGATLTLKTAAGDTGGTDGAAGLYKVVVSNAVGEASALFTLAVTPR